MKILIINPILYTPPPKGGAVPRIASIKHTMIYHYAMAFRELGHEVTLIAGGEYRPTEREEYGIEIVFMPNIGKRIYSKWPNGFPVLGGLGKYLKKNRECFDMVISSEAFTCTSFVASRILPEKLIIWQEVGKHWPALKGIPSKLWHSTAVSLFMRKALFVARSESAKEFISGYVPRVSVQTVDHGIDGSRFAPSSDKQRYFISATQLIPRKNVDSAIRKFADFCNMYSDAYKLYIVGRGELQEQLQRLIESLGMQEKITLCGFMPQAEMAELMRHATAFLTDTRGEYNMVSVAESISCSTPVVMNGTPYSSYYVEHEKLGVVDNEWSWRDMARVVENLDMYVANCIEYGKELSHTFLAQKMIDVFNTGR